MFHLPKSRPSSSLRAASQLSCWPLLLLLLTLGLLPGPRAFANTLTVTSTADDGSPGTLRSQIAAANPGDAIIFDPTVFAAKQTITLTQGTLTISQSLTLTGPVSGVGISGYYKYLVFNITGGSTVSPVTLSGLTIQSGSATGNGGGIYNGGVLTLTNCTLTGNGVNGTGGGLANYGTVSLTNCSLTANTASAGGAIGNWGTLTLTNCIVKGNNAEYGGGVSTTRARRR